MKIQKVHELTVYIISRENFITKIGEEVSIKTNETIKLEDKTTNFYHFIVFFWFRSFLFFVAVESDNGLVAMGATSKFTNS